MTVRAHNDLGDLSPVEPGGLSAAVVIPVYERPDLLERTLAGLAASTRACRVVVVDDGSTSDIAAVVGAADVQADYVRQERNGYGAGRARNRGAGSVGDDADVLVFLDADCIPSPDLIERHLSWQAAAPNLVTVGARRHVGVAGIDPSDIARGSVDLTSRTRPGFTGKADFRELLRRRTSGLRAGDEAFRTFVSSNIAVPAGLFWAVGGFDERFRRWGGEDTELGWRLWQAGAFFVPADDAVVHHQVDEDRSGGHAGRVESRNLNDGVIASLIPHSFYRKPRRDVLFEVPKVSLVVTEPPSHLEDLWSDVSGQTAPDLEVLLCEVGDEHEPLAGILAGDPRVTLVGDVEEGIEASRGELVVTVHGSVALDHRLLARIVKHFHDRPTTSSLTVGYTLPAHPFRVYRHDADAAWVDGQWGQRLPLLTAARRRDWAKTEPGDPARRWAQIRLLDRPDHLDQGLVWIPDTSAVPRPEGFVANRPTRAEMTADLRSHPRKAVETTAKILRARSRGIPYSIPTAPQPDVAPASDDTVHARYVGWTGYDNLGDEAMLEAFRRLLPWASVDVSGTPRDLLLLGGGTLINRTTYLEWLRERDSPRIERAVIGTGVASPAYWGETEPSREWVRWLESCAYVGVRGPRSVEVLERWGYGGSIEVCGDSALLFERPESVAPEPGSVVVSPAWTNGELWGGSDDDVSACLATLVRDWHQQGRRVTFLSCNPDDDRMIFETMRAAGAPDLPYLAGYRDLAASLEMLASAELVVAERLHAAVLAAAVGTPFVSLEYRPKLADFADSVGAGEALVRTDALSPEALGEAAEAAADRRDAVAERVSTYRRRLRAAAQVVRQAVRPEGGP